jgi:hypothetical protein
MMAVACGEIGLKSRIVAPHCALDWPTFLFVPSEQEPGFRPAMLAALAG